METRWIPVLGIVATAAAIVVGASIGWMTAAQLFCSRYHRRRGLPPPPWTAASVVRIHLYNLGSVIRAAFWLVRGLGRDGLRNCRGERRGPPVLCVHGFLMTGGSLWPIRRALERRGRPTRAVFLGWPLRRLQAYALPLAAVLEELAAAFPGEPVDVVAHSMGGLVVRLVAAQRPDLARRLGRIVTLGTPHGGTGASERLRIGPEVLEMGIDSEFLARLPDFRSTAPQAVVTTVAAVPDLVVYPAANAHLPGARQIGLSGVSHLGLLTDRRAIALVLDALGAGSAANSTG